MLRSYSTIQLRRGIAALQTLRFQPTKDPVRSSVIVVIMASAEANVSSAFPIPPHVADNQRNSTRSSPRTFQNALRKTSIAQRRAQAVR